ncbi:hypothetical protein WA026_014637 [Henosepilachna vigintioctopunctata]|uniref:Sarcospan n=1 Tax=Henosepilachna vigintioctopunctata TaxID=420089 RepID=A0AAW1V8B1_9CUCU
MRNNVNGIETEVIDEAEDSLLKNKSPTQTHELVTTVPQNIANLIIGDKHSPTRNSLRHSRMVVLNKGRIPIEDLPPIIKYHLHAKVIMWLILAVGTVISFECSGLQIYTPNSKTHLNPFYTAIPIILSGIFGLVHLSCCRKEYPGLHRNACEKAIKIISITTSVFATITALMYIFIGLIHLISFFYLECTANDPLTNTCVCRLTDEDMSSSIFNNSWNYVDLSCFEVYNVYNVIISLTMFACLVIVFLHILYLRLHWISRSIPKAVKIYNFI